MSQEKAQAYHIVAYEFAGQNRAKEVMELIKQGGRANEYKVPAWAVMEVDENGKAHIRQSGHGGIGTAIGTGAGALLGLVGGPAGLLVWTLGGALLGGLAGKYFGHQFDPNALKALTVDMGPNTSAIIVVVVNNGMYGTIRMHQEKHYPGRVHGTELRNPHFAAYARSFGAVGEIVEETAQFGPAFERCVASGKPSVIEVRIDPQAITPNTTLDAIRSAASKK